MGRCVITALNLQKVTIGACIRDDLALSDLGHDENLILARCQSLVWTDTQNPGERKLT